MLELLAMLRAAQLLMHHAHNICFGSTFMQDHFFFGDSYEAFEKDYDDLIERIIGVKGKEGLELKVIMAQVMDILPDDMLLIKDNKYFYMLQLRMEETIGQMIQEICKTEEDEGIKQLLGDMKQTSQIRQYKIKQRIG